MRVVSLACSNTEIVCALGCGHLLVGVDNHSDRPVKVVSKLPRVGPDLQIDIDAVAALKPDLVLASLTVPGHEQVVAGLEEAGLEHLAPEPVSLEDIYRDIEQIASALGVAERGKKLVAEMRAALVLHPEPSYRPKLLVQWWNRPTISPAKLSWVTELIGLAGGQNPLATEAVKSRPLADDEVAALNPDAMIISWCGVNPDKYRPDVIYRNSRWQNLTAVREERVFCVPEAFLGRPGPGLLEGYEALRDIVKRCA